MMIHDDMRVVAVRKFLHGFEGKDALLHAPSRAPSHEYRPYFGTSELSMGQPVLVRKCSCPLRWVGIGSTIDMEEWCLQPRVSVGALKSVISIWKLVLAWRHCPPSYLDGSVICGISLTLLKYEHITEPSTLRHVILRNQPDG